MAMPENVLNMTVEEYLASEEVSTEGRHEYVDGQIFAMTGATDAHNIIVGNLYSIIRSHIKGSGCLAYVADMKVRIEQTNCFYYPDVMVTCEPVEPKGVFKLAPVLICEVLSPSTSAIDKREKRLAYRQIDSLKEYLIVHQEHRHLELYRRERGALWTLSSSHKLDDVNLTALPNGDLTLTLDAAYEDSCV